MREVIRVDKKVENEEPVEFTHMLSASSKWEYALDAPVNFGKVVYLGKCSVDGDMFACYDEDGGIEIMKGHLNSGKY